jgi:hypothetical protein
MPPYPFILVSDQSSTPTSEASPQGLAATPKTRTGGGALRTFHPPRKTGKRDDRVERIKRAAFAAYARHRPGARLTIRLRSRVLIKTVPHPTTATAGQERGYGKRRLAKRGRHSNGGRHEDKTFLHGSTFMFDSGLDANTVFDFAPGGVDEFEVLGIDPNLGPDPNSSTDFASTLTFVAEGRFTGTMTPISNSPLPHSPLVEAQIA